MTSDPTTPEDFRMACFIAAFGLPVFALIVRMF